MLELETDIEVVGEAAQAETALKEMEVHMTDRSHRYEATWIYVRDKNWATERAVEN